MSGGQIDFCSWVNSVQGEGENTQMVERIKARLTLSQVLR